jgi:hypothetical protein
MAGFAPSVIVRTTHRLGQAGEANLSVVSPASRGQGVVSLDQPARLSSATLTPAPMVELIETFFK